MPLKSALSIHNLCFINYMPLFPFYLVAYFLILFLISTVEGKLYVYCFIPSPNPILTK